MDTYLVHCKCMYIMIHIFTIYIQWGINFVYVIYYFALVNDVSDLVIFMINDVIHFFLSIM